VFPDNPTNKTSDTEFVTNFLNRVLEHHVADKMKTKKHDIRKPQSEGGELKNATEQKTTHHC
jgi:hypothetical protein